MMNAMLNYTSHPDNEAGFQTLIADLGKEGKRFARDVITRQLVIMYIRKRKVNRKAWDIPDTYKRTLSSSLSQRLNHD